MVFKYKMETNGIRVLYVNISDTLNLIAIELLIPVCRGKHFIPLQTYIKSSFRFQDDSEAVSAVVTELMTKPIYMKA